MSSVLFVDGKRYPLRPGWNPILPHLGVHRFERIEAIRIVTNKGCRHHIATPAWEGTGYLLPRSILTIRPDSPLPTHGLLRPYGEWWSYNEPGGKDISLCGDGDLYTHDAIMQRMPISLVSWKTGRTSTRVPTYSEGYWLTRGWRRSSSLPDYSSVSQDQYDPVTAPINLEGVETDQEIADMLPYDGQHLVRAFRAAVLNRADPIVVMDLRAMASDAMLAWSKERESKILGSPRGEGHGDVGREWAYVSILSVLSDNPGMVERMRNIALHVYRRDNGLLQALREGEFWGSPHPWSAPPGGSGVPQGTVVAQDIEACVQVVALMALGLDAIADKLFATVCAAPKAKWIDVSTGQGVGAHGADIYHVWMAIGALCKRSSGYRAPRVAATKWRIPTQGGSSVGPFDNLRDVRHALQEWRDIGKTRWALEYL